MDARATGSERARTLTGAVGGGEVETRDLAPAVAQDADQLTLVRDSGPEAGDGVRVQVAGNDHLLPGGVCVFLRGAPEREKIKVRLQTRRARILNV